MKSILAQIASILASMPKMAWEKVLIAGQLVWSLVVKPADPVADFPEADGAKEMESLRAAKAAVDPELDLDMMSIRHVALHLRHGFVPTPELSSQVPEQTFDWLLALDDKMLDAVAAAKPSDLRAHVMGRKSLKGVLICDPTTVEEFTRRRDAVVDDEDALEIEAPRYV